jgi:hypothetical protein
MELVTWLADDLFLLNTDSQFPTGPVFLFMSDFSWIPLCSEEPIDILRTSQHNGLKKSFTKK